MKQKEQKKSKIASVVIRTTKFLVFAALLIVASMMYRTGAVWIGNDVLIVAVLFIILNKLDYL